MIKNDYPKILFITPLSFNKITGTGITFTNLFKNWPKTKIATVTGDTVPSTDDVCDNYYYLSNKELSHIPPFSFIVSKSEQVVKKKAYQKVKNKKSLIKKLKKSLIGEAGIPEKGILTDELAEWIKM